MKKLTSTILAAMLMLLLAACNQTAEPAGKEEEATQDTATEKEAEAQDKDKESDLTLEEVFKKTEEANKDVKSFASQIKMNQTINAGGEEQKINTDIDMDFIVEPMALHQKMTMSQGADKQQIDAYLIKDGFYMYEPTQKMWVKLPAELSDEILHMSEDQTNPSDQLDKLKEYVDEFDFKQDEKNYILTLKASGDKFDQLLKDTLEETMTDGAEAQELMADMKFNKVEYELFIDKETFLLNALNVATDSETKAEDQKVNMIMDMESTYSDYNQVKDIEIPKEALENAQELNMEDLNG